MHQALIMRQIVPGQQHGGDDFARFHRVMQIGTGELAAGRTIAIGVQRRGIVGKAGILQIERALRERQYLDDSIQYKLLHELVRLLGG